jgi:hypothetical protein
MTSVLLIPFEESPEKKTKKDIYNHIEARGDIAMDINY